MSNGRDRPYVRLMMAMTLDGRIATSRREAARFGSSEDARRLEEQVAWADILLMGAETLRAYGTTYRVKQDRLLQTRREEGRPLQPTTAVVTRSLHLPLSLPFFRRQEVPRIIVTVAAEGKRAEDRFGGLAEVLAEGERTVDWTSVMRRFSERGFARVLLLGGGQLNAELLSAGLVDDLHMTVTPHLFGGNEAPSIADGAPVDGELSLESCEQVGQEVFLNYTIVRRRDTP